jgi:hypothetical protein
MGILAAAKNGIYDYLRTTAGLTEADGVMISSAPILPTAYTNKTIVLGDITVPQTQAGLRTRERTASMGGLIVVNIPGENETAKRTARDNADDLMDLVEGAFKADRSAAGTVGNPGRIVVTTSGLEESPGDANGAAFRRAEIPFTLSWTSHIT